MRHNLKTWPEPFQAMKVGLKTFEFRLNDRGYQVGDILHLEEYHPDLELYTDDTLDKEVIYILGEPFVKDGWVIMSVIDPRMKKHYCDACGEEIEVEDDYQPEMCCSGMREACACMGLPINPVFCDLCEEKIHGKAVD